MSNTIKKLEQDFINSENKLREYLFNLFEDSGKIKVAFETIKNNTNLEVDEIANVVLSIAPLEIELSNIEVKYLMYYMKKEGYRIETDAQDVYSVYCIADYKAFIDKTKQYERDDAYYPIYDRNGKVNCGISSNSTPNDFTNCMFRTEDNEIIFTGK